MLVEQRVLKNQELKPLKARALLIYPALYKVTGLPVGLASLSAVLKESGHAVKIFDTSFYTQGEWENQTRIRAERGMSKEIKDEDQSLPANASDMQEDIIKLINDYKPDIIGISILEMLYDFSLRLTQLIKKTFQDIPIIAGGVFPTLSPERVMDESSIDIVCVGEGETALLELCNRVSENKSFVDIDGLWVKSNGKAHKNNLLKLHNINVLPHPDYTEFDEWLFCKPMQGRMYKMVNIETSRGCPFNCTYCAAPHLARFFKESDGGQYFRQMEMEKIIDQIHFQIKKHTPEFIYFSSENFISMSEKVFNKFIAEYEKINLPFWIQTRIETITEKRLSELKRVGLHWLSIGLEHGNKEFRKRILKRKYSNKMFIEKMEILRELDMGASINNMIGFPFETRELIFDTIKVNRALWQRNPKLESNAFVFTPYRGCELYDMCIENGLFDADFICTSSLNEESVLNFPKEFKEDLKGLIRTFNLYVKLPEKYHEQIKIAEQGNEEGDAMLQKLSNLLKKKPAFSGAAPKS